MKKFGLILPLLLAVVVGDAFAQTRTIRGLVQDAVTAELISFPQVTISGTSIGTVGDEGGSFVLTGAPASTVTLIVARIGFVTQNVVVTPDQSDELIIQLTVDYLNVEELVVTGRAVEVRKDILPNAVGTVNGQVINQLPQQTVDQAIQGRVSNAVIVRNSGAPGGGFQLNIRGSASINAAAEPLYVVDGVIVANSGIASNQNELTRAAGGSNPNQNQDNIQNRIADLNIKDIEDIEILKGAAAAAIYGSKASNGVVIITTRRGQVGSTQVNLGFTGGYFDLSNTIGARQFETEAEAVTIFGPQAAEFFNQGRTFDHEAELAGRNDFSFEATGQVAGGGQGGLQYFGSVLWKQDEGIIGNTGFDKQSVRANLTTQAGNASINVNTNLLRTDAERSITNNGNSEAVSHWMVLPGTPNFIDLSQSADGGFPVNVFVPGGVNPLQTADLLTNSEEVYRLIGSVNLDWQLHDTEKNTFSIIAPIGVDWFSQDNRIFSPPELHFEPFDGLPGTVLQSDARSLFINSGVNGVWAHRPSATTTITASAGFQYELRDLIVDRLIGKSITAGKDKADAATTVQIREQQTKVEDFGFYGQVDLLTLDDSFLISGMLRAEQSSANGDTAKIFVYPKAAVSYRIRGEEGSFLENLKFRAAFGQSGNQPLCDLINGCQKFTSLRLDQNIEQIPGLTIENTVGDPNLIPERMSEIEGGVDIVSYGGRLSITLTGYYQSITNLILQQQVAESTGFNDEFFNGGRLENYGVEFELGATPFTTRNFTWISRTTFSRNISNLAELEVPAFRTNNGFGLDLGQGFIQQGQSVTTIAGLEPNCIDATTSIPVGECIDAGLARFGDQNPDFFMGFSNEFTFFNNLQLYTLFEWRQGQEVVNLTELLYDLVGFNSPDSPDDYNGGNLGVIPQTPVFECYPDCNAFERADAFAVQGQALPYTQPGSFFKAREISLAYVIPPSVLGGGTGVFKSITLRASARDLFRITNYRGLDPEVSNFGNQPVGRSIDVAPFPPSRSFWLGFDLTL